MTPAHSSPGTNDPAGVAEYSPWHANMSAKLRPIDSNAGLAGPGGRQRLFLKSQALERSRAGRSPNQAPVVHGLSLTETRRRVPSHAGLDAVTEPTELRGKLMKRNWAAGSRSRICPTGVRPGAICAIVASLTSSCLQATGRSAPFSYRQHRSAWGTGRRTNHYWGNVTSAAAFVESRRQV
jgi:hypothetical protein